MLNNVCNVAGSRGITSNTFVAKNILPRQQRELVGSSGSQFTPAFEKRTESKCTSLIPGVVLMEGCTKRNMVAAIVDQFFVSYWNKHLNQDRHFEFR